MKTRLLKRLRREAHALFGVKSFVVYTTKGPDTIFRVGGRKNLEQYPRECFSTWKHREAFARLEDERREYILNRVKGLRLERLKQKTALRNKYYEKI